MAEISIPARQNIFRGSFYLAMTFVLEIKLKHLLTVVSMSIGNFLSRTKYPFSTTFAAVLTVEAHFFCLYPTYFLHHQLNFPIWQQCVARTVLSTALPGVAGFYPITVAPKSLRHLRKTGPARGKQNQFALIIFIFFVFDNNAGLVKELGPGYSVPLAPPPLCSTALMLLHLNYSLYDTEYILFFHNSVHPTVFSPKFLIPAIFFIPY